MLGNARPQTASLLRAYLNDVDIVVMDWPAMSPNINPIEHI